MIPWCLQVDKNEKAANPRKVVGAAQVRGPGSGVRAPPTVHR